MDERNFNCSVRNCQNVTPLKACRNRYGKEEREVKVKEVEDESGAEAEEKEQQEQQ
jgi:hypothetical protein